MGRAMDAPAATPVVIKTPAATISVSGPTLGVDVATLTPTDGDLARNTNAALACLVGPTVYQTAAAKWKGLYSGVTN